MDQRKTSLERAFELARSGKCFNVMEIGKRLKSERLDVNYLEGPALKQQLLKIIEEARQH
jgi:hypothetical protein